MMDMIANQQLPILEVEASESILPDLDLESQDAPERVDSDRPDFQTEYSEPFSQLSFSELVDIKVEDPQYCNGMEEETIVPFSPDSPDVDALDNLAQSHATPQTANNSHSSKYPGTHTSKVALGSKSSSEIAGNKCAAPLSTVLALKRKLSQVKHIIDKPIQFMCNICSIEYENGIDLANHMRLHATYTCRFVKCNDVFPSTALRQRHELIHVQEIAMAETQEIDVKPEILSLSATSNSKPLARKSRKTNVKPKPSKPVQRSSANSKPRAARKPKSTSRKNTVISRKTKQVKSPASGTGTTLKIPYVLLERLPEIPGNTLIPSLTSTRSILAKEPYECCAPPITQSRLRTRRDTPSPDNYEDYAAEISPPGSETESNYSPNPRRDGKSEDATKNRRSKRKSVLSKPKTHSIPSESYHKCRHCSEYFPNRSRRTDHERSEHSQSDKKSYICTHCNKEFEKQWYLTRHSRIHTGEKRYQCRHCNICFGETTQRARHESRVHNGGVTPGKYDSKSYICTHCNKGFEKQWYLTRHSRIHTGEKRYQCRHCNICFGETTQRARHESRVHNGGVTPGKYDSKSYICTHCNKGFEKQWYLTRHSRIHTGEKRYQCRYCDIRFAETTPRARHENRVHKGGVTRHKCELCDHQADSPYALTLHNRTHTGERPFECEFENCMKKFSLKSHLAQHIRIHTGDKAFQCRICDEKFISIGRRIRHERMVHPDRVPPLKSLTCEQCHKSFSSKNLLEEHIRTHTGEKPFACHLCEARFSRIRSLKVHLLSHAGVKPYPCKECPARFTTAFALTGHRRNKHASDRDPRFLCEYCSKSFNNKERLKVHTRIHTGEKPFSCTICELKFTYKLQLRCHNIKTHPSPEDKNFICEHCGKSFWRQCDLETHVLTHTGEKPFVCEVCGEAFRRKQMLAMHTRLHTGETFDCEHCGKKFIDKRHFRSHLLIHSTLKPFDCRFCDSKFADEYTRRRHEARVHDKSKPEVRRRRRNKTQIEKEKAEKNSVQVGEKPFSCAECDARFFSQEDMLHHIENIHSIVKNFKCQYCPRTFETRLLKQRHERTHTKYNTSKVERPFNCEVVGCGKTYSKKINLIFHQRNMHGRPEDKKFVCQHCQKRFCRQYEYKRHLQIHAGRKFQCNQCSKSYSQYPHLVTHILVHSGDSEPFKCFTCKQEFVRRDYLRKHIFKHHCPTQDDNTFASCSDYTIPEIHFSEGDNAVVPGVRHNGSVTGNSADGTSC